MRLNHCCEDMRRNLERSEIGVVFIAKYREYGIRYRDGGTSYQEISYCPWCGGRLPSSLRERWLHELSLLGLEPGDEKIPEDFASEAWYLRSKQG
jgi:hypothetical protein